MIDGRQVTYLCALQLICKGLDNIEVDPSAGKLWIGTHPAPLLAAKCALDPLHTTAPSQVIELETDPTTGDVLVPPPSSSAFPVSPARTLFLSAGQKLSAVSVGAVLNSQLIAGTFVGQDGVLVCDGF